MRQGLYRRYLLIVLLLILAASSADRFALGIVLQDIKVDLALSDTQLGLMTGIAFSLFYSTMGIPIARWADRGDRVRIIAITTMLWSVAVALCGAAGNFLQLLLIRIGIGVGEAGCVPAANSLLANYFDRAERPQAAAVYWSGASVGLIGGYLLAGWLSHLYGWRSMFVILATPGLALSTLAWFTLKEPRRRQSDSQPLRARSAGDGERRDPSPRLITVWGTLWRSHTFRHLLFGLAVMYFFFYGVSQWQPTFFIRSYGLSNEQLGVVFAAIYGTAGLIGTYGGGSWAVRYAKHNEGRQLKTAGVLLASLAFVSPIIYLTHSIVVAFTIIGVAFLAMSTISGPFIALLQSLAPERMRAMSIAIVFLFANLIGMGLGPLAVGALSDALRPWAGDESLRYSLLALTPGYLWVGWHLWRASKTVREDLLTVEAGSLADFRQELANRVSHGDPNRDMQGAYLE